MTDTTQASNPKCEGCGHRPEVYGSSWCARCSDTLPRYVKDRLLTMRNALIAIGYGSRRVSELRAIARNAIQQRPPQDSRKP